MSEFDLFCAVLGRMTLGIIGVMVTVMILGVGVITYDVIKERKSRKKVKR